MIPKFRAWDTFFNEFVFDVYIGLDGLPKDLSMNGYDFEWPYENVILMQSTGLFDKNGKEIFEGDIVVNEYDKVGYVAYLQQEAGFVVVLKKSDYRLGHRNTGESYEVTNNHEIIGNVYQNPDLMEDE